MIIRLSMALGNKKSVDDAAFEPSLDAHLQIAPNANKPNPLSIEDVDLDEVILIPSDDDEGNVNEPIALPVEDADVEIAPHHNHFFKPKLLNWNWDDVIIVPSNDDEPISLPVEDVDVEIAPHHNPFFNPKLLNWNWDEVIVVPSDDDEGHAEEDISTFVNTQVHVKNRKRVFALIDESDSDDEPYWSNAFLF
ncbi:hypothetical protein Tco_0058912 [Tanacetum coccineum]